MMPGVQWWQGDAVQNDVVSGAKSLMEGYYAYRWMLAARSGRIAIGWL